MSTLFRKISSRCIGILHLFSFSFAALRRHIMLVWSRHDEYFGSTQCRKLQEYETWLDQTCSGGHRSVKK